MNYKGHEIEDHHYNGMSQVIKPFENGNYTTLDWDELEELQQAIVKKKLELANAGKTFKDIMIEFWAVDDEYNPNGADTYAEGNISVVWMELETPEQKEERIARQKKYIDETIENEKRMSEVRRLSGEAEIARALQLLNKNGYTVTKKK